MTYILRVSLPKELVPYSSLLTARKLQTENSCDLKIVLRLSLAAQKNSFQKYAVVNQHTSEELKVTSRMDNLLRLEVLAFCRI